MPEITIPEPDTASPPRYLRRDPWNFTPQSPATNDSGQQKNLKGPSAWERCTSGTEPEIVTNFCAEVAADESEPSKRRSEAYLVRARAFEAQGQTIAAIADVNAALELEPKFSSALYYRGLLWTHEQNYDQAIRDFSAALAASPKSVDMLISRGIAYRGKKDFKRSLADLDRLASLKPKSPLVYYERGLTKLAARDHDGARSDLKRAIEIDPNLGVAYFAIGNLEAAENNFHAAINSYDTAQRLDGKLEYYITRERGNARRALGDCTAAIADFTKALAINARAQNILRSRAGCLVRRGRYDEAVTDFTRALYITPEDAQLFAERGHAFLQKRDFATAARDTGEALKRDSKNEVALLNRARLKALNKDTSGALMDLQTVVGERPDAAKAADKIWLFLAAGEMANARKEAETLLAQNPRDANALYARGFIRMKNGEVAAGKSDMVEAVKIDHDLPYLLNYLDLSL